MSWWDVFVKYIGTNPFRLFQDPASIAQDVNGDVKELTNYALEPYKVRDILENAQDDPTATQGEIAKQGLSLTPEQEKWLDNLISQQNTASNNAFQEHMRDTSTTSQAQQLESIGLSSSGVLSTGGAASGVTSAAADNSRSNIAMERYQQRMALARQLLSMTSSMASAGIYGNALGAAKKASSVLTSSASHSALKALNRYEKPTPRLDRAELLRQLRENELPSTNWTDDL